MTTRRYYFCIGCKQLLYKPQLFPLFGDTAEWVAVCSSCRTVRELEIDQACAVAVARDIVRAHAALLDQKARAA